ncbi:MAG: hypothetical protein CMN78_04590 [Spirochaetales bacterium]|nr:hypothetical protein [Spirochaetales bacterium]
MKDFLRIIDGQKFQSLICFTDVTGFAQTVKALGTEGAVEMLRDLATTIDDHLRPTPGWIVKYIGDASLIVFPDEWVDEGVRTLLSLKQKCDAHLEERELPNKITFAMHFGEIMVIKLPPIEGFDVMGDAVNTTARLEGGRSKGRFVISPQVFRKLKPQTRKSFHKFTPPIVYYGE